MSISSLEQSSDKATRKRGPKPQVAERVVRVLQSRLASGEYPAGSYLPAERALSEELQVSRPSVAAAIQKLSDMGVVERHVGRGSYILPLAKKSVRIVHTLYPEYHPIWNEAICLLRGAQQGLGHSSFSVEEASPKEWGPDSRGDSGVLLIKLSDCLIPTVQAQLQRGLPCVVANLEQDCPDLPASVVDHRAVAEQATSMLLDMGHRRIGYVGNEPGHWFYAKSEAGYQQAIKQAGIACEPQLMEQREEPMILAGYLGARAMLQQDKPPTAIVAARDGYAHGVCVAAKEAGLVVGRDLSVIGYDDLTAPRMPDFLTTFRHPGIELGQVAAQMLLEWMLTGERPDNQSVEAPLVMRRSVGPAPTTG